MQKSNKDDKIDQVIDSYEITSTASCITTQTLLLTTSLPIDKFIPVFGKITKFVHELAILYQTANHNKRICGVLYDRIQVAGAAVENLKVREKHRKDFFTKENLTLMLKLEQTIREIMDFAKKVRELRKWLKFFLAKSINDTFTELTGQFDGYMNSLNFIITINTNLQIERDNEVLKADIKQNFTHLQQLLEGTKDQLSTVDNQISKFTEIKKDVFDIKELNIEMQKGIISMLSKFEETSAIIHNFHDGEKLNQNYLNAINARLQMDDFDDGHESRGKIRKKVKIIDGLEVALKEFDNDQIPNFNLQISILTRIKDSRDIIQFHGFIEDENHSKKYLVTEWAEHRDLRSYYKNPKNKMDIKTKLGFALDIARGLNFLEAYAIYHHDVRSENVMITFHKHAKISNFGLSRGFTDATRSFKATPTSARYMAPEKLRDINHKYCRKCEVFSFGMLLWEIAELKFPFEDKYNDIMDITSQIMKNPISLVFTSDVPEGWKRTVFDAVSHRSIDRIDLKEILRRLGQLKYELSSVPSSSSNPIPQQPNQMNINNILSIDDAIKQLFGKKQNSNDSETNKRAYETIEEYAELGDIKAKFYIGYLLFKENRFEQAVQFYKESAEGNFDQAQFKYAECLFHGKGVPKDHKLAFQYFLKAANQGGVKAMFYVGKMIYNGIGTENNLEQGQHWIRLAAHNGYEEAIDFCINKEIKL
ncbi:hypothetical protein Glove_271g76 [Diversispora epigaea]|uniref:Protein kinase domain-containing protein n=1 Tax=Diversispora epigaea TaxID=1348612 RepID=A0A397I4A3_9GLOM|nr:hypothetical protein Glove_271g76 [Diversispora epigaea]